MKKEGFVFIFAFILLLQLVSAISLDISKRTISEVVIAELAEPARFDFQIRNLDEDDTFEIYSLVGVDFSPKGTFFLAGGDTERMIVEARPEESVRRNQGYYNFVYKIRGSNTGIQDDTLRIKIVNLKDALEIRADSISVGDERATVYVRNKENFNFTGLDVRFSAAFLEQTESFDLPALSEKGFEIELDQETLSGLMAGQYILNGLVKIDGVQESIESTVRFLEQAGLPTIEIEEGVLLKRHEIQKTNEGNVPSIAEIQITKGFVARIFTTFNVPYDRAERVGGKMTYSWQRELRPGDTLKIVVKTNWLIPIVLLIIIVVGGIFIRVYLTSDLILKKSITHVRTKGGEFALKVTIRVRARRYVDNIHVLDKLPPMVKLYERYGTIAPDRIDEKNRRIEWNISTLNEYEETILSYIVYSKIGIVGRFELPPTTAVYERDGKVRETSSNRVFFMSEPRKKSL